MEEITRGDLVIVTWFDCEDASEWTPLLLVEQMIPPKAKTVGWFINEDASCVRIAYSICGEDVGRSLIPKGMIQSIEKIQEDELEVT